LMQKRQWRAVAGFAVTACLVAAISAFLAPPREYLHQLTSLPRMLQGFVPAYMIGIRGLAKWLSGNANIDIGNVGVAAEAKTIRIGSQGTQPTPTSLGSAVRRWLAESG